MLITTIYWAYIDLFLLYLLVKFSKSRCESKRSVFTLGSYVYSADKATEKNIDKQMLNKSEREKQRITEEQNKMFMESIFKKVLQEAEMESNIGDEFTRQNTKSMSFYSRNMTEVS